MRLLVALFLALTTTLLPAQTPTETEQTPTATEPAYVVSADIPTEAERVSTRLRLVNDSLRSTVEVEQIASQLESAADELERMLKAPELEDPTALTPRALDALRIRWIGARDRLGDWQKVLAGRSQELEQVRTEVRTSREPWAETLDRRRELELPDALVTRVRTVIKELDQTEKALRERLETPLTLQNRIAELTIEVNWVIDRIDEAKAARLHQLLVRDAEPLWKSLVPAAAEEDEEEDRLQAAAEDLGDDVVSTWRGNLDTIWQYLSLRLDRVIALVVMWAVLCALLLLFSRRRQEWMGDRELSADLVDIATRPLASATLLAFLFVPALLPSPPVPLQDLIKILVALTLVVLLWSVIPRAERPPVYALLALYLLDVGSNLVTSQAFSQRLLLFVSTLFAVGVLILLHIRIQAWPRIDRLWSRAARIVAPLAILTMAGSSLANLFGAVAMATLLAEATLAAIYLGLGLYVLSLVLRGLLEVAMRSPLFRLSYSVRRSPDVILGRATSIIRALTLLAWVALSLRAFGLLKPAWEGLFAVLDHHWQFGAFEISPGDILAFVIALWLGAVISRLIRFILAEDVFPRVRMARGVPATISTMVHYGIITLAFFIALAAAGFEIGRFAIVAGALGVGIGFGLQNIVNNFISGLILAFERPIQVGDTVEVGTLIGRVRAIGIRASTVRTFDGAEVIVPNGNFISAEVINWTLSDVQRRVHIPVGVSYGSNPHEVIKLLVREAQKHPDVQESPEPFVVFVGYGASSIDFELRVWTDYLEGLRVKTELYLAIWDALKEAGIEIPFPQQDLHLRTVAPEATEALSQRPPPGARLRSVGQTQGPDDTSSIKGME